MEEITARTTELLQPLIKKPKLTPKLLGKPPFRFLHDIVSELARSTGFGVNLYSDGEMDASSIKDKESKILYLEKIHKYVCAAKGDVPLKLGKVVAGMEADKTNEFLQVMAEAAVDQSINRDACLAAVLGGPAPDDGAAEAEAAARAAAEAQQMEEQRQMQEQQMAQQAEMEREQEAAAAAEQAEQMRLRQQQDELMRQQQEEQEAAAPHGGDAESEPPPMPAAPVAPQHGGVNFSEPEPDDEQMAPPPQMERRALPSRPTTARRPPPKLPSKEVKIERTVKEKANVPGAPTGPAPVVVGLISEGAEDDEEEEEEEKPMALPGWDIGEKEAGDDVIDDDETHGALMQDILNEKKKGQKADEPAKVEEPKEQGIILKKKDRRGSVSGGSTRAPKVTENDVNKLRQSIQLLCTSTMPVGKCLEYVQEDLENMASEYRMWKAEGAAFSRRLEQTSNNRESSLQPLIAQVQEEEQKIKDMNLQINRVKYSILQNNTTIHGLLRGVVAGHR